MSSLSPEQLQQYISDLNVTFPDLKSAVDPAESTGVDMEAFTLTAQEQQHIGSAQRRAAISARSLEAFLPDVTPQMQEDVLNSMLLAQMAADNATGGGPEGDPHMWYGEYRQVLAHIGWSVHEFSMSQIDVNDQKNAGELVLQLAREYLTPYEFVALKLAIFGLAQQANSRSRSTFDSNAISISTKSTSFNVGVVSVDQGNPKFKIGYHAYTVAGPIQSALYYDWADQSISFQAGHQTMILDSKHYDTIREAVILKLQTGITSYIDRLIL